MNKDEYLEISKFIRTELTYPQAIEQFVELRGEPVKLSKIQYAFWDAVEQFRDELDTAAFSCFKKFQKSTNSAFGLIIRALMAPGTLHLVAANSKEQSTNICFKVAAEFFENSELWGPATTVNRYDIKIKPLNTEISVVSSKAGAIAGQDHITLLSTETAYVTTEADRRALAELALPPAGRHDIKPLRIMDSYAPIQGQGQAWSELVAFGLNGECLDSEFGLWKNEGTLLMHHEVEESRKRLWPYDMETYEPYYHSQKQSLDEGSYSRLHLNRPSSAKSDFDPAMWEVLMDRDLKNLVPPAPRFSCFGAVDIGLSAKGDSSVACLWYKDSADGLIKLAAMKEWASKDRKSQLDLGLVEQWILDHDNLEGGLNVVQWAYDPYQFARSADLLMQKGCKMVPFKQSLERLGPAGARLMRGIREQRFRYYDSPVTRGMADNIAVESVSQGLHWKKSKTAPVNKMIATIMKVQRRLDISIPVTLAEFMKSFDDMRKQSK